MPMAKSLNEKRLGDRMWRLLLALNLALAIGAAVAAELTGVVTDVHDGDTVTLVNLQFTYRIRLVDIDAPELAQPRGMDSRTSLRELCLLKQATVETQGEDRFLSSTWTNCVGYYEYAYVGTYVGEYRDNKFNGQGALTYPDGKKYVGGWRESIRHGKGTEYGPDGSVLRSGIWENNNCVESQ